MRLCEESHVAQDAFGCFHKGTSAAADATAAKNNKPLRYTRHREIDVPVSGQRGALFCNHGKVRHPRFGTQDTQYLADGLSAPRLRQLPRVPCRETSSGKRSWSLLLLLPISPQQHVSMQAKLSMSWICFCRSSGRRE